MTNITLMAYFCEVSFMHCRTEIISVAWDYFQVVLGQKVKAEES